MINKLKNNVFSLILINNIQYFFHNFFLKRCIEKLQKIDSIADYNSFKQGINKLKKSFLLKAPYMYLGYGRESMLYGHFEMLVNYSNFEHAKYYFLPKIEHGINPTLDRLTDYEIHRYQNFVFQSSYKTKQILDINNKRNVYSIGPYIMYANLIYSEEKIKKIKTENGKTLLIFPFHNYEFSTSEGNDQAFVDYVMNNFGTKYDTIYVSVYWNDINDEIYKLFEKRGAKLISAGFRGDKNFIHRLKTMIELSDDVCGNGFGTHIGYALYMNKRYFHIETERVFVDTKNGTSSTSNKALYEQQLNKLFKYKNIDNANLDNPEVKEYIEFYWGKMTDFKSREEIYEILKRSKNILEQSKGNMNKFSAYFYEV